MTNYIEYDLGDGATILIEAPDKPDGVVMRGGRKTTEDTSVKAKKSFCEALKDVKAQARILLSEVEDLNVSEAEIKFGVNTVGELGNLAIGKIGVGVNYEVTLKWKKAGDETR
jgi:hypothetical protein